MILIGIILPCALHADANSGYISARAPETVNIGRSFDVVLSLESSEPIKSVWIKLRYDSEYISFSKVYSNVNADAYRNEADGVTEVICLFNSPLTQGDIIYFTFTAKTGNESSTQTIYIETVDAVTNNCEKANLAADDRVQIYIEKKNSYSNKDSSQQKNSAASEKSISSNKPDTTSNMYSRPVKGQSTSKQHATSHKDENTSALTAQSGSEPDRFTQFSSGRLSYTEDKVKYFLSGIGLIITVLGILYGVNIFRNTKRRITSAEPHKAGAIQCENNDHTLHIDKEV